jgi:hypothetical protein
VIFTVYLKTPTSFNEDYFKGIGSHRKKAGIDQIKQQVIARRAIEQWILLSALHAASQLQAHAVLNLILLQKKFNNTALPCPRHFGYLVGKADVHNHLVRSYVKTMNTFRQIVRK